MQRRDMTALLLSLGVEAFLMLVALRLATFLRGYLPFGKPIKAEAIVLDPPVYLLALVIWLSVFLMLSLQQAYPIRSLLKELKQVATGVGIATLIFAGALYLSYREVPRMTFIYFALLDLFLLLLFRLVVHTIATALQRSGIGKTTVLIVGAGKAGMALASSLKALRRDDVEVVGYLDDDPQKQGQSFQGVPVIGTLAQLINRVKDLAVDQVIFALPMRAERELINSVLELEKLPVDVKIVPDVFDLTFSRVVTEDVAGIPMISLRESAIRGLPRLIKRGVDLLLACVSVAILWPFMLLIAILIKWGSPGPAIFKQKRVGENCKIFTIYKFRSMIVEAESGLTEVIVEDEKGHIIHKRKDDPRLTRIGRLLRRTSLDELPQLFNVIKGDMSLVGPRPEVPELVDRYEPWQRRRFAVPPGMTGWWQIKGRSQRMMHLHTEDDLYYIQHYSLLLDLEILLKTIGVVIRGQGAY
jgi:exopolysaccharide biosynthesis polyprenyl glycosylphosphotransferase